MQILISKLCTNIGLCFSLTFNKPEDLPSLGVNLYSDSLSIFYLRSSFFTFSLLIHIACVLIIPNKLFTILSTIHPFEVFSSHPIHKRPIAASLDLLDVVLIHFILFYWVLTEQNIPSASSILFEPVTYLGKLSIVRVCFICNEFSLIGDDIFNHLLLIVFPFVNLFDLMKDSVNDFILTHYHLLKIINPLFQHLLLLLTLRHFQFQLHILLSQVLDFLTKTGHFEIEHLISLNFFLYKKDFALILSYHCTHVRLQHEQQIPFV